MDERIGQYRILRKLGEGGVGEVFLAEDEVLCRPVAMKRLRAELASRESVVERFRAEAQTLARLNHPNIATLHSFERYGDTHVMVMEYVEGETVSSWLQRSGPMPIARALALFVQALDGIGTAHERGIVHRDIKGANLIVTPRGVVKVMDFGIARVLGEERITRIGQLVGTPETMSPEQIRGEEVDARSDIYSLGALLYTLLAGRPPFAAGSEFDVLKAQVEARPPSLAEHRADVPPELEDVLLCALEKDPGRRFPSTAAFRDALAQFIPDADTCAAALAAAAERTIGGGGGEAAPHALDATPTGVARRARDAGVTSLLEPNEAMPPRDAERLSPVASRRLGSWVATAAVLIMLDVVWTVPAPEPGQPAASVETAPLGGGLPSAELWGLPSESGPAQPEPTEKIHAARPAAEKIEKASVSMREPRTPRAERRKQAHGGGTGKGWVIRRR